VDEVVFINCFQVPVGREDEFMALWTEIDSYMLDKPGFKWRRLHRALDAGTHLRYVNVAGWTSAAEFEAAHDENFVRMQRQAGWLEFPAEPALYMVQEETVA
jgi:heme oxygenase (mycobilin-producing)